MAQIAKQAESLDLPLIAYPGLPPVLTLGLDGNLERGSVVGSREPQTLATQTRNLSVPGFTVGNALSYSVSSTALTDPASASIEDFARTGSSGVILAWPIWRVHAGSGLKPDGSITISALGCAVQLRPSLAIVSIGANDALQTVLDGLPSTDPAVFQAEYLQLVYTLKQAGAQIIVANVPDVTQAPVLESYAQFEARCGVPPSGALPDRLRNTGPDRSHVIELQHLHRLYSALRSCDRAGAEHDPTI